MAESCGFKVCRNISWSIEKLCLAAGTALDNHSDYVTLKFQDLSNWFLVLVIHQNQKGCYPYICAISNMIPDSPDIMHAEYIQIERIGKGYLLPATLIKSTIPKAVTVNTDFFKSLASFYQ